MVSDLAARAVVLALSKGTVPPFLLAELPLVLGAAQALVAADPVNALGTVDALVTKAVVHVDIAHVALVTERTSAQVLPIHRLYAGGVV